MELNTIMHIILGASAIIVAAKNIYQAILFPKEKYSTYIEKQRKETTEAIRSVVREEMKQYCGREIFQENALKLLIAAEIEKIYWCGKEEEVIFMYNQRRLVALSEAYHDLGGNNYIDSLITEMATWKRQNK